MSSWKKVKGLFWQSGAGGPAAGNAAPTGAPPEGTGDELSDADFAALLQGSPHAVPSGPPPAAVGAVRVKNDGSAVTIDFQ